MSDTTTTTTAGYLRRTGEWVLLGALPLMVQSIAWTVLLACFAALLIVQTRRKRRRSSPMIFIFSAMFALVSLGYAIDLFWFFIQTRAILLQAVGDEGKIIPAEKASNLDAQENVRVLLLIISVGSWLVSTLLGDVVVFWRAWELSSHNVTAKRLLVFAGAVLLSYMGTIPVVLICQSRDSINRQPYFDGVCGNKALVNWCLSVLSNLLSTCAIASVGWGHRTEMRKLFQSTPHRSVAEKILGLLAESGFIYFCVNVIFVIVVLATPSTYGAGNVVASIFVAITIDVGAFVPMATHVIVLIYGSLWDTMSEHSGGFAPNHITKSIEFARASRISPDASLDSSESVLPGIQGMSKETSDQIPLSELLQDVTRPNKRIEKISGD